MRHTTIILAVMGSIWALTGIAGWFLTLDSFRYVESGTDLIKAVITICLLISGYWVWFGWVRYSFTERFPKVSDRTFWLVSFIHHAFCILYLIPMDVWGGGDDPWWIPIWIIANLLIAVYFLIKPNQIKPIKMQNKT